MGRLEARSARRTVAVGTLALVLIGAVMYLAGTAHTGLPWAKATTVTAEFSDVHSLKSGDEVRQNSVRVGMVDDIRFADGMAVVTMRIEGSAEIHRDARAAVWDFSSLGTKFIELHPGTPEAGPLDERPIAAERTADSADLYHLLDVFDAPTREAATNTIREVGGGVAGMSRRVHDFLRAAPDLLSDTEQLTAALASDTADLPALLRSAHRIAGRFVDREEQIADLIGQTDKTMRGFTVDDAQPLRDTLSLLPEALSEARTALDALDAPLGDIETAATELRPGAEALGASTDDLRGLLREGVPPLRRVPEVAELAEPAVRELTQLFADARPLAPLVARFLQDAVTPLQVLAPYAPEIRQLAINGESLVAEDINGINYARIALAPSLRTAGGLVLPDELMPHNNYPKPGEVYADRTELGEGGTR